MAEGALTVAELELKQDGEVVWATMNRPARLNAPSRGLVTELREFFAGQDGDFQEGVRAFLEKRPPVYAKREG